MSLVKVSSECYIDPAEVTAIWREECYFHIRVKGAEKTFKVSAHYPTGTNIEALEKLLGLKAPAV